MKEMNEQPLSNSRYEMRLTGSGGQGVIMASVILAEAAIIQGKNAIQSQAYGPEARGGTSKAETIIGENELWYSKVNKPNFLLALTQEALNKYYRETSDDAIILMDSSIKMPEEFYVDGSTDNTNKEKRIYSLPILSTAKEEIGKPMTANIVAVGAINGLTHLFPEDVLQEAVKRHIPRGTEELNMRALAAGERLAKPLP